VAEIVMRPPVMLQLHNCGAGAVAVLAVLIIGQKRCPSKLCSD
jgi:hypothetical protein